MSIHLTDKRFSVPEFLFAEDLGVTPLKSCVRCKSCAECGFRATENVLKLSDNKDQAVGPQKYVENMLIKNDNIDPYNEEFKKALDKGYIVKLGDRDLVKYQEPVSYVSHFPVYNLGSKSTPVRVVTNSRITIFKYMIWTYAASIDVNVKQVKDFVINPWRRA